MHYKNVIFDIDGTLLDTESTGLLSLQKTVKEILGKDIPLKDLYRFFGVPSGKAVIDLNFPDPKAASRIWEKNFQNLSHLISPFPGVEEMLKTIKSRGATIGIVTSRNRKEYNNDKYMSRWSDLIDCSICAEDSPRHKPFPDPIIAYINKNSSSPSDCIYIGDTIHDYHCGHNAGIDFALALWKKSANVSSQQETEKLADYIVHNCEEILQII